jgi:uncharacterized protein YndB with AHSA1/START domain
MIEAIRQGDIPGVQLRRRQALPLAVEDAWRWLVEPARLARWLADEAAVGDDPRGVLRLSGRGEDGLPLVERGRTVEIVPPRLWVLSFEQVDSGWPAATRLTLRLHPIPPGCELDVLQDGFQRLPLSIGLTVWESYRRRWRSALERLAAAVAAS